jgi:hypothetical protein
MMPQPGQIFQKQNPSNPRLEGFSLFTARKFSLRLYWRVACSVRLAAVFYFLYASEVFFSNHRIDGMHGAIGDFCITTKNNCISDAHFTTLHGH